MVGEGTTLTVTCSVEVQVPVVPLTVYTVLTDGEATTVPPPVLLSPEAGLQLYDEAPETVKVVDAPAQSVPEADTASVGGLQLANDCTQIPTRLPLLPPAPETVNDV